MVHRIEVGFKREPGLAAKIRRILGLDVTNAFSLAVYSIDDDLNAEELDRLAEAYCDRIVETPAVDVSLAEKSGIAFDILIEKRFRPGVTDAVGKTAKEVAEAVLGRVLQGGVYSAMQYLFSGKIAQKDAENIAASFLGNPLIEEFVFLDQKFFKAGARVPQTVPTVKETHEPAIASIDLTTYDTTQLSVLNQSRQLGLSAEELAVIKTHYRDKKTVEKRKKAGLDHRATDAELEVFAQTWSEHCKHKEFNAIIEYKDLQTGKTQTIEGLFPTYVAGATTKVTPRCPWLVSVFKDNAGIVKFNDDYLFAFKVETHNSPSALDPYGGALTGIVGNNRDVAGCGRGGADLWFNQFHYCIGETHYEGGLPPKTLHPRQIFEGIVAGVRDGGNKCGIPTLNGGLSFDARFMGKPLIFCGTGGLMRREYAGQDAAEKDIRPGDAAVVIGGRIGKDGIHGATMSSAERSEGTPVTAVQIGDPIVQKKALDFLAEARDLGLMSGVTDNGAGGLSSSFGEMARLTGGVKLDLAAAPLKYHGLDPWEILVSEAQERMSAGVPLQNLESFLALAKKRGVEATVLGAFTDTGFLDVRFGGKPLVYLDLEFLHEGVPRKKLQAEWKNPVVLNRLPAERSLADATLLVAGTLDACSKEWVFRQKDHNVKGGTLLPPIGGVLGQVNAPASLIRPVFLDSHEAVATSQGIFPKYADFDAFSAGQCAFNDAVGKIIALGGTLPDEETFWSACDNFCVPDSVFSESNPDGKYKLAQLVRLCESIHDYAVTLGIPFTSGKDSMKNDLVYQANGKTHRISVPPTLLISLVAKIADYRKTRSQDFKCEGDWIYAIGVTREEMGGSQYFERLDSRAGRVPRVDPEQAKRLFDAVSRALAHTESARYVSQGGFALAFAECALSGNLGASIDLNAFAREGVFRDDLLWTSETQSRFLVSVRPEKTTAFEQALAGIPFGRVGTITKEKALTVKRLDGRIERLELEAINAAYTAPLREDLPQARGS